MTHYSKIKNTFTANGSAASIEGASPLRKFALLIFLSPLYTQKFRQILKWSGVEVKQVPSPICNPYAERFVKSIKYECLNHIICFGENMLKNAVKEYVEFYNTERPHQNLDNELIAPDENKFKEHLNWTKSQYTLESLSKSGKDKELIVKTGRGCLFFACEN